MKPNSASTTIWERVGSWRAVGICAALVIVTLVAYGNAVNLDFVDFDDFRHVVDNPYVNQGFTTEGIAWSLTNRDVGYWAPLLWLSYMFDIELYGSGPSGHHVTNLALHVANVLLLFGVLGAMTRRLWASGFVALIFAVHPLNVESVAWVSERKNVLSTFFWLLAMGSYASYVQRRSALGYGLTAAFMALGLMTKAMLVTLPCVLLLLDYWPLERVSGAARRMLRLVVEKVPLFALSAAASVATYATQREIGAVTGTTQLSLWARAGNISVSYLRYIRKLVWPDDLAALYPYPGLLGGETWTLWEMSGASLLVGIATALVLSQLRRRPYLFVGWFWYLGTLVPVIGLVQVGQQSIADRYMYVPMIGLLLVIAWGISELSQRLRYGKHAACAATLAATLACVGSTRVQVGYWHNTLSLFERAAAVTDDNWVALNNVAWLRATCPDGETRDAERAVLLAERACKITRYQDGQYLDTLAAAYAEAGRFEEAVATSKRAIRLYSTAGREPLAQVFRERLAQYEQRRPYRSSQGCP